MTAFSLASNKLNPTHSLRRFSGYLNDEVERRELAKLREAIRSSGDDEGCDFDRYYVAGYDPPFKLLGRRNEIWVVKKVWEPEEEEVIMMEKGSCGDFVLVEKEEGEEELMVVNGVVKEKEKVGESDGVVKNGVAEDAEAKDEVAVEKGKVATEKTVLAINGDAVEENVAVVKANGVVGKENGEVVFLDSVE